ncbi:hypothetical protein EV421DRAFT_1893412 [Armillaria borealis]|uniref:Uncharacterized protein n=1 Tax=Armillaria borealis TaxID=47425 RepID=A0AA39IX23_9AGAR|nr:hypothetical protein EV421DRAFT_1893412 [Armillaria borealis]
MIFAGDFAQLPPIQGENASLYGQKIGEKSSSERSQEQAMGKSLWHQITTVKQQSSEDSKLRTALENLRYNACTQKDIAFWETRVISMMDGKASVSDDNFHNVSVITSWNIHKDEANLLGQTLTDFYSDDSLCKVPKQPDEDSNERWDRCKLIYLKEITNEFQHAFWNQPPSSTDLKIPGKLSLCVELGITKGQEGTVYVWQSSQGSKGQCVLDTLFVLLLNPPAPVQFNGLPLNVVPLVPTKNRVSVNLPEQVEVLPNFAMTDYASQGKTHAFNVVDLHKCKSHQSMYTCLSCSASAEGTLILQGLSKGMRQNITKGASGALRQEFCELELLDEITALRFEGNLRHVLYTMQTAFSTEMEPV